MLSPNPWTHSPSSPRILQRGQCLMLANHGHTETKSTERQQRDSKVDTEHNLECHYYYFVQNMSFDFVECFSSFLFLFFFQHIYCI